MFKLTNTLVKPYLRYKYKKLAYTIAHPILSQQNQFNYLMSQLAETSFGKTYGIDGFTGMKSYTERVPVHRYDDIKPYIRQMMDGASDVLWPGKITMYSKSSGTTSDQSKFIPVSSENMYGNHIKGAWETLSLLYKNYEDIQIFAGKNLLIPGSIQEYPPNPEVIIGDISALMTYQMPMIGRPFLSVDVETALMQDFEEKINIMASKLPGEQIVMIGGVPTWNVVLFRKILKLTGKDHLLELWPDLQVYIHGGVGFEPYREQFKRFIPKEDFIYQEVYNATEGYFATKDQVDDSGLLLLLNNGIFYEFIPMDQVHKECPEALPLKDVVSGKTYAIVISTNGGLWRYMVGDLVKFVSTDPYRIVVEGRTAQYINVFGEELMVANTDKAIAKICEDTGARISNYTVAPIYFKPGEPGGHQWLVEFSILPEDIEVFAESLDRELRRLNSDYDAKRFKNLALKGLSLEAIPEGTFVRWLKHKGKLGAQAKVPRLSNDRNIMDSILNFISDNE